MPAQSRSRTLVIEEGDELPVEQDGRRRKMKDKMKAMLMGT